MTGGPTPLVRRFAGGGFGQNGYLVSCPETREGILVDPGAGVTEMLDAVRDEGIQIRAIVLTHAHIDHVDGVAAAKAATGAPIHLHPLDEPLYTQVPAQAKWFGIDVDTPPPL